MKNILKFWNPALEYLRKLISDKPTIHMQEDQPDMDTGDIWIQVINKEETENE